MLNINNGQTIIITSDINNTEKFTHDKQKTVFKIYIYDFHRMNESGNRII